MTDIIEDNVNVKLQMGTTDPNFSKGNTEPGVSEFDNNAMFWDAIELKVELTQASSPNYVKGKVTPQPQFSGVFNFLVNEESSDSNAPNNGISVFVGARFRLAVDNDIVAVPSDSEETPLSRAVTSDVSSDEEDNLLFDGRVANISPVGTNVYEFIAYDPGQQAFNTGEDSGSVINQKLELTGSSVTGIRDAETSDDNNFTGTYSIEASEIVDVVIDAAGIEKAVVDLGPELSRREQVLQQQLTGENPLIEFRKSFVRVKDALDKVAEATRSEWWFDKDGTFYFGNPAELAGGVRTYNVNLITDTSAGITTPPYQSVRVIGSGVATTEGWSGNAKIQDDDAKLVVEANIGLPNAGTDDPEPSIELDPDELVEPTFKYINAEISTDKQAQNTVLKIADELIKQQADGTVTVVGFPEVQPFDGIVMPNSDEQPMGGQLYDVYAVRHKLNATDGFITEIDVAGPNPSLRGTIDVRLGGGDTIVASSVDSDVYTPDGERRAFNSGAGRGDVRDTSPYE